MGFLRRHQQPDQASAAIVEAGQTTVVDHIQASGMLAVDGFVQSEQPFEDVFANITDDAEKVESALTENRRIIERTSFKDQLMGIETNAEFDDYMTGKGLTKGRRRLSEEDSDSLKLAVLSARLKVLYRLGKIDEDPDPKIFFYAYDVDSNESDRKHFMAMVRTADFLEPNYYVAESGTKKIISTITDKIDTSVDGVEDFLGAISAMAIDDTPTNGLKRIIARNIHDQGGMHEIELSIENALHKKNGATMSKFIDFVEYDDGLLKEVGSTFEYARKVASRLAGREVSLRQVIQCSDTSEWPKALQDAYSAFNTSYVKEVTNSLRALTQPWDSKVARTPSVKELRALENRWIIPVGTTLQEQAKKRGRVTVSDVYIETTQPEVKKAAQNTLILAETLIGSRGRLVRLHEGIDVYERVLSDFIGRYKLDANEIAIFTKDISKILKAITTKPTGVRGTTSLEEVRPFQLEDSNQTMSVWRANPAHYTGLSVSRLGKDLRALYCVRNGNIGVIGIYRHEEYEKVISTLR